MGLVTDMPSLRALTVLVVVLTTNTLAQTPASPAKRDSAKMQASLTAVLLRAAAVPVKGKPLQPLRTSFTDRELNAWFTEDGKDNVPVGLVSPKVTFTGPNALSLTAMVDLDAVRTSQQRGRLDPMAYLTGMMAITMTGTLSGTRGQGLFDVQSSTLGNVPIPKILLQELITYYSKSPQFPEGISLTKPFALPSGVRELMIQRGSATIVQ